jgi:two-component system chemotaxis response regulator CheB
MTGVLQPEVVAMDLWMPGIDGLETLRLVMDQRPTPVVMICGTEERDGKAVLESLERGAVDFIIDPSLAGSAGNPDRRELGDVVKLAAGIPVNRIANAVPERLEERFFRTPTALEPHFSGSPDPEIENIVVITAGTGGPRALSLLLPDLPVDRQTAYLIVQQLPSEFTRLFAERLDLATGLAVREAVAGEFIEGGTALVAPGGRCLVLASNGEIDLIDSPPVHTVRPPADVTLKSVARAFSRRAIAVVLTGEGADGRDGAGAVQASGGTVIAEDESSCAVFQSPRASIEAGYSDIVAPLADIAKEIQTVCNNRLRQVTGAGGWLTDGTPGTGFTRDNSAAS